MRLQRLDLERFGHFTDKTLDFGERSDRASDCSTDSLPGSHTLSDTRGLP